ncbi:MAG: acyl-CoA carboxylase epsilon subunit [Actinocatenispora sp.]
MDKPMLRVVRGEPTDDELAALVAVLAARAAAPAPEEPRPSSLWRDHAARLGVPPAPGPLAWRASFRPH